MPERSLLSGWGRSTWSSTDVERPANTQDLRSILLERSSRSSVVGARGIIARGLGRSYGDQATNAGGAAVDTTGMANSTIEITTDGIVEVDGGASVASVLSAIVPRGWFLPVVPGTRHVTMGGAIANDVHGKNHHVDGSLGDHVIELELMLADGTLTRCGPDREPRIFWATVGGMGLTGIVVSARVRLLPIPSSRVSVDTTRIGSVEELMPAMIEADRRARYSVAWVDLQARGSKVGRSVLTTGDFAPQAAVGDNPLAYAPGRSIRVPAAVPSGLLRRSTISMFNEAWYRAAPRHRVGELQTIGRFFHPLDGLAGWNRLYGRNGLLQWQVVVPLDSGDALLDIVRAISGSETPSFLGVVKRFGSPNPAPLSFPIEGWTLAADFPAGTTGLSELLDRLDLVVAEAGGRVYLAKDGRLDPALLDRMYPRLPEWKQVRDELDPGRVWQSDLARRLRI